MRAFNSRATGLCTRG